MISLFCLLVTLTSATADPPIELPCTTDCTQISTEHYCDVGTVRVYDKTHCLECSFGKKVCQPAVSGDGPTCTSQEETTNYTRYEQGFAVCKDACSLRNVVHGMPLPSVELGTGSRTRYICTK